MPREFTILSDNGLPLEEGSRIAPFEAHVEGVVTYSQPGGVVTSISDPDGDMDDYGQIFGINPNVTVLFDDGVEDSFGSYYEGREGHYVCEDLEAECGTCGEPVPTPCTDPTCPQP